MHAPIVKLIALLLVALQGLGMAMPGGTVVCVNLLTGHDAHHAGAPAFDESVCGACSCGCHDECSDECRDERPPLSSADQGSHRCACCVTLPPLTPQVWVSSQSSERELERALASAPPAAIILPAVWNAHGPDQEQARCLPPPDRLAHRVAQGLASTRLIL